MQSNFRYHGSHGGQDQQLMASPNGVMPSPNVVSPHYQSLRGLVTPTMPSPLQRPSPMTPNGTRFPASPGTQHMRQSSVRSIHTSPRLTQIGTPQSAVGRSAFSMSPPPGISASPRTPRMSHASTNHRRLPSKAISDANIDDAFIAFILYANPSVTSTTDTSELRKVFRCPPKSDGKLFSVFRLWELIRKLDKGELKTWVQLALDLGVEPPSADKGQSTQKIQQYAVRLKRWMHAMHVDAFFEYCLGKPHVYYTHIPSQAADGSHEPRDGVPLEEDLALRALLPEWKPKRGRRKASEREDPPAENPRASKRPHIEISPAMLEYQGLGSASMFPQGDMTWSAFPDDVESQNPWSNTANIPVQSINEPQSAITFAERSAAELRWNRDMSPTTYPQTAIEPSYNIEQAFDASEPRSAITPSSNANRSRPRRRHGSAVSSAWLNDASSAHGKARGRPSLTKSVHDGHFSTFSANPKTTEATNTATRPRLNSRPPSRTPSIAASNASLHIHAPTPYQPFQGRPGRLQLQVPRHEGGPVRLATPPTVTLNAHNELVAGIQSGRSSADFFRAPEGAETLDGLQEDPQDLLDIDSEDVANAFAARILHGKLVGRPGTLSMEEATLIAKKAMAQLRNGWSQDMPQNAFAIRCATALGVSSDLGIGSGAASTITVKSMPQPLNSSTRGRARPKATSRNGIEYVLSFDIVYGSGISSAVQIHNIFVPLHLNSHAFEKEIEALRGILTDSSHLEDSILQDDGEDERTWKERYVELKQDYVRKEGELRRMKRRVFEVVMENG